MCHPVECNILGQHSWGCNHLRFVTLLCLSPSSLIKLPDNSSKPCYQQSNSNQSTLSHTFDSIRDNPNNENRGPVIVLHWQSYSKDGLERILICPKGIHPFSMCHDFHSLDRCDLYFTVNFPFNWQNTNLMPTLCEQYLWYSSYSLTLPLLFCSQTDPILRLDNANNDELSDDNDDNGWRYSLTSLISTICQCDISRESRDNRNRMAQIIRTAS